MWNEHDAWSNDCGIKELGMVEKQKAVVENGVQKIRITAEKGYSPKEFQLQKGIPAEITFHRVLSLIHI